MKRLFLFILPLLLLFSSCAAPQKKLLRIEDTDWQLRLVQSNTDGSILARGEGQVEESDAPKIKAIFRASKGRFSLVDESGIYSAEGTYHLTKGQGDSALYELTLEGETVPAGLSYTKYSDGSREKTLVIRKKDCSLYFTAPTADS